jgi:hypothetical protein
MKTRPRFSTRRVRDAAEPSAPDDDTSRSQPAPRELNSVAATSPDTVRDREGRDVLTRRVRAEFQEMPGMQLTLRQAQRLFGLPSDICQRVLGELMREGFLCSARDGMFARREFSRG